MSPEQDRWRPVRRRAGPLLAGFLALVWMVMALRRPDATFHLAPTLVAASWGAAQRAVAGAPSERGAGVAAAVGGAAVAGLATGVLGWAGALSGPTLWHEQGALGETILAVALGAALGYRFVTRHRAGLLFSG